MKSGRDTSTDRVESVIHLHSPYARRIVATDGAVVVEEPLLEVVDPRTNRVVASDFRDWQYGSIVGWDDEVWGTSPEASFA